MSSSTELELSSRRFESMNLKTFISKWNSRLGMDRIDYIVLLNLLKFHSKRKESQNA